MSVGGVTSKPHTPPRDPTFDYGELKRKVRTERKLARMPNRAHRACFWTWPWGHVYKRTKDELIYQVWECAVCGKTKSDAVTPNQHSISDDFARVRKTLVLGGSIFRSESLDALTRIEEQYAAQEDIAVMRLRKIEALQEQLEVLQNGCEQALLLLERHRFMADAEAKVVRAVLIAALDSDPTQMPTGHIAFSDETAAFLGAKAKAEGMDSSPTSAPVNTSSPSTGGDGTGSVTPAYAGAEESTPTSTYDGLVAPTKDDSEECHNESSPTKEPS